MSGKLDLLYQRSPAIQLHCVPLLPSYPPAPSFGKTCGIPKSPALAGSYEGAKGFSEIGGREAKKERVNGIEMKSETSQER